MSGYLARLTLRALGRPVSAGVVPHAGAGAVPPHESGVDDAPASEREIASSPMRPQDDRDGSPAQPTMLARRSMTRPALAVRQSAADAHGVAERRVAADSRPVARSPGEREPGPAPVRPRIDDAPAEAASRELLHNPSRRAATLSIPPAEHGGLVDPAARVARSADSMAAVLERRLPADSAPRETGERHTAYPTPEQRTRMNVHPARNALAPTAALSLSRTDDEPASVMVEIGRIEVKVAPPPAPPPRASAAPQGFEGYWRMRNYLDRRRD